MFVMHGKEVLERLDEFVRPQHTALVLVGMHQAGHLDRSIARSDGDPAGPTASLPRTVRLLEGARDAGVTVVWVRHAPVALGEATSDLGLELPAALAARPGDVEVVTSRVNAFLGSDLLVTLRSRGVRCMVTAGLATEGYVQATADAAVQRDFYSVLAEDCVASFVPGLHTAALAMLRNRCEVHQSTELLSIWAQSAA